MSIETMTTFLGWCSLINFALLMMATIQLIIAQNAISAFHARLFGLEDRDLKLLYIQFLAVYKLLIFVFNVVPYFALKLMAR